MVTVHLLMGALVELKLKSNSGPLLDLFNAKSNHVRALIKDLGLCNLDDYSVQDLMDEFPSYDLPSPEGVSKEEDQDQHLSEEKKPETVHLETKTEVVFAVEGVVGDEDINEDSMDSPVETGDEQISDTKKPPTKPKSKGKKFDEPLKCPKCPFTTHFKGPFRTHQRVHEKRESTREYTCKVAGCSAVFTSWDDYRRHGPVAHKRFICDTCGLKCSALGVLKDHKARHLNKQEHICSYCQRGHNTITDLRKHIQVYHLGVANYLCDTCGLAFRKKATRDEHQLGHSDVYAFACKMCDKKFKKKPQLQKHINIIHEKVRIPCPYCEKHFPTQYLLNSHIECAHNIQTRFTCDVCVATYRSQETLDNHRARHDNPHDLECARCLILFPSQEQLGDHLCITYRDDYVCCGRDLRYHGMYNRHMQLEHGITTNARVKPVPGALMAKMIAQRKRIETCPKCKQTFATRTLKKQHVETCMGSAEQNDGDNYGDGDVNPSSSFKM
ncbi:AAEL013594-PA [Aedes aegypti]|uniref:AAEL013594-PA n=1 Tax=Aedes aegypti TaxID=7159 RepID=Q16IN8_AEDAE|nr:AAEL013594-PA [Aedes aegypti]